jgi:hypothetical protein
VAEHDLSRRRDQNFSQEKNFVRSIAKAANRQHQKKSHDPENLETQRGISLKSESKVKLHQIRGD